VDVVGLYMDPPERAVVLCVDKKSQESGVGRFPAVVAAQTGTGGNDDP